MLITVRQGSPKINNFLWLFSNFNEYWTAAKTLSDFGISLIIRNIHWSMADWIMSEVPTVVWWKNCRLKYRYLDSVREVQDGVCFERKPEVVASKNELKLIHSNVFYISIMTVSFFEITNNVDDLPYNFVVFKVFPGIIVKKCFCLLDFGLF